MPINWKEEHTHRCFCGYCGRTSDSPSCDGSCFNDGNLPYSTIKARRKTHIEDELARIDAQRATLDEREKDLMKELPNYL